MATLPPWSDSMSDGCSVPGFLRWLFPVETPEQRVVCIAHDRDYYFGGTRQQRLEADAFFYGGLILAKMPEARAKNYFRLVRAFGGPELHWLTTRLIGRPQAWAYGGGVFAYTGE